MIDHLINMTSLEEKKVKCVVWERNKIVQGVITGVSTELTIEDVMSNLMGAKVEKAKRLMYSKDGVKKKSLSILF